ncbi:N-acetylmuramoyl-L-alanine amidase [Parvibaculum sp.]|uniref:N-acetylmuramoyl-L-alanine amidase n=1 Tax=Parvibaculum sp. TaxID=2024848 RepID=UPI00320C6EE0
MSGSALALCSLILAAALAAGPANAGKGISETALPAPTSSLPDDDRAALDAESAPSSSAPGDASLANIRIGDRGAETRFVIELGGPQQVAYRVFTLADPYRVIVDFPKLRSTLPADAEKKGRGLIAGYRLGRFQGDRFRVVIDAAGPVTVARNFVLEPQGGFGRRIVIDLGATDRAGFLKTAEKPDSGGEPVSAAASASASPASSPVSSGASGSAALDASRAGSSVVVPAAPPARHDRRRVIVIDPGHGGVDPGTHGTKSGIVEKNVVLAFAKELARRLRATGRYDVHLTRDRDIFIPLRERVQIGRRYKADLFISIHADSIAKADVKGMSVYTLSETASDKEAAELARKENLSDAIAGIDFKGESPEVTGILIDLAQRETKNYSVRFAKSVVDYAGKATYLLEPTHRFAGFVVLKAPDVPSVLVELGFLTNATEEKRLTSPKWRTTVSNAFVRAVDRYFGERLAEGPN